jgi:hypothetical protein
MAPATGVAGEISLVCRQRCQTVYITKCGAKIQSVCYYKMDNTAFVKYKWTGT